MGLSLRLIIINGNNIIIISKNGKEMLSSGVTEHLILLLLHIKNFGKELSTDCYMKS